MALFKKQEGLVGLDIGSAAIKIAEIEERKQSRVLAKFGLMELSEGAIEDGVIKDHEKVAETIKDLCRAFNIKQLNAAISIAGYSVIIKNITVKTMTEEEMQESISVEAEQYLPFDIQDVYLDFHIVGNSSEKDGHMDVVLVAAKKDLVDEYVSVVEMAGLHPVVMDVDAFAVQNIYELLSDVDDEIVALVDVGASKTSVNIIKNRNSVLIRDVAMGGAQITQEIMKRGGCSYDEAEQWKADPENAKMDKEELNDIIALATARWCEEIRPAFDFFYSMNDERLSKIVMSGGSSGIIGFKETLAAETGVDVFLLDPFAAMDASDEQFDPGYLKRIGPQATIALGLALRRAGDK
ncbi:type IV pilus assembly protein PilM [Desulfatibacillum alkenivorans DSM 16219]|jgi:type IV pilus assembly protein PilM|uniref:Type IV pilus assembly protein PilM n=1 Tax=Desulfatibacillum alkenivorans DSM 16219 TaxID=1121393 RepID=A0A1M6TUA4_9BACT|nr:type IV pilus assembly protein PilM [Desulfatibacillum alkenivorans]SHK60398.1 type IV pilus assembly protein PilM [Desulfatibacillum alkenivorans DSM 16219]